MSIFFSDLTKCQREFMEVGKIIASPERPMDGPEYPVCNDDNGLFAFEQCLHFTQTCFCVDVHTGREIPNTGAPYGSRRVIPCQGWFLLYIYIYFLN